MKTPHLICNLAALVALSQSNAGDLRIAVQIDGRSQLVVTKNDVYWNHIQWSRPGMYQGDEPTMIGGYAWYPLWTDNIPINPGKSQPLKVSTEFSTDGVSLLTHSARGSVTITQQPTPANDFTLVVEFYDSDAGADDYDVTLSGAALVVLPEIAIQVATVAISFLSDTNTLYQMQYLPSPTSTQWVDWGAPVPGVGTNLVMVEVQPEHPYRLFRVLPLP